MINRFLNKSDEEQLSIVIDILKKDYAHNFSEDRTFKYKDIAKYTLKLMNTYGYFNEDNPLLMSECNEFKICFQPNFKGKKRLDRVIVYFAHMITGDKGDLRVLDIEKARTIDYLMKVLQSPTKMYYQNGRNSFLFERQILLNESHQNCHMVLYIEKIKFNMMRVVTILPNVNKNRTKMQKENNSITEISSFHQLRHFISPSVGEDFGNGGEILTNNDTNIQNNLIECTPEDEIILKLIENQQDNFLKPTEMSQENIEKIEKLEKAINSPATPENIKETMRKALEALRNEKVEEVVTDIIPYKTYSTIKSCLLDDGDDSDDYIYEGKRIHNIEVLPKDTWEIVEFYNYGVVLKHIPTSVLADSKPNKNVSLDELKVLFASDKIEIDGIEKGNTKVFNLCIKAIIKCIDSLDMAAYKENLLAELNVSKNELEKTIEASNLLESEKNAILSEKSNLEKESAEKIQTLESDMAAKSISMEEAKAIQEAETLRLKKQIEDLDALNSMRTLIDMLTDDIAKKDFKETPSIESNEKIKVKEIRLFAAEGKVSGYGFPKVVNTYEEANDAVMPVYEDAIESSYANKCRFTVTFEDGETYNGDLFVGAKYDNPTKGNVIGKHIKDYLESEIKENRQSEETKKEIREFFEKYDLGFDENKLDEKNPKYKVGDILLHEYMGEKQKAKILAVTGWTGDGHRYEIEFVDKNNNGIGKFATSYDDILTKDAANGDYEDINAFVDYVNDFYGKDGIYAKDFSNNGFTKEEIKEAVNKYISDIDKRDDDDFTWGDGDSVDRERVRTYLEKMDSEKYYHGGEIHSDDKVIITTSSLGKKYKGMQGVVTSRKLTNDKYSIKLEDGMEMAFAKDEFRHNSTNPRFEKGGKVKGTWGATFPEVGREGMYKGSDVIVTANRAGDILFDELDEDEKVVKSDKASLSEFRSYFRPFAPRETDVIYEKGGEIKIVQKQLDDNKDLSFEIYPKGEKMTIENGFHGILVDGKLKNTIYIGNEYYDIDGVVYKNDKKTNLKL